MNIKKRHIDDVFACRECQQSGKWCRFSSTLFLLRLFYPIIKTELLFFFFPLPTNKTGRIFFFFIELNELDVYFFSKNVSII
jgi:hypothetical protein